MLSRPADHLGEHDPHRRRRSSAKGREHRVAERRIRAHDVGEHVLLPDHLLGHERDEDRQRDGDGHRHERDRGAEREHRPLAAQPGGPARDAVVVEVGERGVDELEREQQDSDAREEGDERGSSLARSTMSP